MSSYLRFAAMIGTSMLVMYGVGYLNTFVLDHVYFSQTRLFMTLLMGASMSVIMLAFMWKMYPGLPGNLAVLAAAALVFVAALVLLRTQATVDDVAYLEAMIPHHSIAILTSTNAEIGDPRVRELADTIIATQREEIARMQALIADLREGR